MWLNALARLWPVFAEVSNRGMLFFLHHASARVSLTCRLLFSWSTLLPNTTKGKVPSSISFLTFSLNSFPHIEILEAFGVCYVVCQHTRVCASIKRNRHGFKPLLSRGVPNLQRYSLPVNGHV